jgi:hypothetical protein
VADYRALAQALDPYAVDSGGITPDTMRALQNIKAPNLLGMISDIGRGGLSNLESLVRGGVAQFAGTPVDTLNTIRTPYPMEVMGDVNYAPDKQVYGGTKDILGMLPQRVTQARPESAGMEELGTVMGPGLAKGVAPVVKGGGNLLGMAMNERLLANKPMLPSLLKEPQTAMFAVNPQEQMAQAITKAEVSPLGFYSAVEQQALKIPRKQGTGDSFLNDLMKGQDVKKYEIEAMGLEDYLRGKPNVTRQEVQDFIAGNRINVQEKILDDVAVGGFRDIDGDLINAEVKNPTKYDKYQLPGGDNYRELLLTLPNQWEKPRAAQIANEAKIKTLRQEMHGTSGTDQIRSEISRLHNENTNLQKQISEAPIYKSSHFNEPNILAHMRVNDRVDAEGKKMLLIEEVQSDWHQAGRDKGYKTPEFQKNLKEYETLVNKYANTQKITPEERTRIEQLKPLVSGKSEGVPDAPFKDTWHQLALKRAIKEAVDKGYDRIGLTTGAQQAERYDLSKQINKIDYRRSSNNTFELGVVGKNGESVDLPKRFYTAEELPSVLGKEVADKIIKGEGQGGGGRMTLSGLDLQVGGEGMKKYYDEIYPNYLNKLGKKYGSQVGETNVKTQTSAPAYVDYIVGKGNFNDTTVLGLRSDGTTEIINQNANSMEEAQQLANRYKEKHLGGGQEKVRYLDITPEMRKAIKEGQPLASIEDELAKALA